MQYDGKTKYLYVFSNPGKDSCVSAYSIDGWRLSKLTEVAVPYPSYGVINNGLYLVSEQSEGKIFHVRLENKKFSILRHISIGKNPCHIEIKNNIAVIANWDGKLQFFNLIDKSSDAFFEYDGYNRFHSSRFIDDKLLAADFAGDCLLVFDGTRLTKTLNLPKNSGPRSISFDAEKIYVTCERSGKIFQLDKNFDILKSVRLNDGSTSLSDVCIFNKIVYVGSREGKTGIAIFDENLTQIGFTRTGAPRSFCTKGNTLFVGELSEGTVLVFEILQNGLLKKRNEIFVKSPYFVGCQ
jgi:6-phosphogluconolactonase (cycloisomerase 2 family)